MVSVHFNSITFIFLIDATDVQARAADHVNVTKPGTIASFFASIMDPRKIQCVLDLPLAHTTLPQSLKCVCVVFHATSYLSHS
jgi:hypothetical protein